MHSNVKSNGAITIKVSVGEMARLRAFTREVTGKQHPNMEDITEVIKRTKELADKYFRPKGGRYPKGGERKLRIEII